MTDYNYAHEGYEAEKMAKAVGRDLSISTKQAIEICNSLRKKNLQKAKALLEDVIAMKRPIRFTRFTNGIGHRKGNYSAGAYPQKAATAFLKLLTSVEINAQNKGLNTGQLLILHICAHRASRPMHYGRKGRAEFKRSHVEIVVAETKEKARPKIEKKEIKKEPRPVEKKAVAKSVEKKPEVKKEAPKKEIIKEKPVEKKEEPKPAEKKVEDKKEESQDNTQEAQK